MDLWVVLLAVQSIGPELESRYPHKKPSVTTHGPTRETCRGSLATAIVPGSVTDHD